MSLKFHLQYKHLLPSEACELAEFIAEFDEGVEKEVLVKHVEEHEDLEVAELNHLILLLLLSKNVELDEDKIRVIEDSFCCKGVKTDAFKDWERKARKENSDTIANIIKEQKSEA
jgi:hypothetical protein